LNIPALAGNGSTGNGSSGPAAVAPVAEAETPSANGKAGRGKRLNPIKLRQMQERCTFLEEEIPRVEAEIISTERALGEFVSVDETRRLTQVLEDLRVRQTMLTAEWEETALELEQQES
jgi:ATP-binding cassette, subfamily F, member 3